MMILLFVIAVILAAAGCEETKDPNRIIGGQRVQLIEAGGSFPTWSPDGSDIVYIDRKNLWRIAWPEGEPVQLTDLDGPDLFPNFNPVAGKREIVFVNKPGSGESILYVMNVDKSDDLTEVYTSPRDLRDPTFSSDGSVIVFQESNRPGLRRIAVEGGEPEEIVNAEGWDQINFSKASPHSNTVLYVETRKGVQNLYRISIDGGQPESFTSYTGKEYPVNRFRSAAESYDGTKIALSMSRNDPYFRYTLWTIPSSGAITFSQISEVKDGQTGFPAWSPDGERIAVRMGNFFYVIELEQ